MKVKVISLLQPWESLVVLGHKRIETRSWKTSYRGELFIHASAGKSRQAKELCTNPFLDFRECIDDYDRLPFGSIIGRVELKDTTPTENIIGLGDADLPLTSSDQLTTYADWVRELTFGDYSPGRYGWLLSGAVPFDNPIPAKGMLGIWEYDMPA